MKKLLILPLLLAIACTRSKETGTQQGWKPVYATQAELRNIQSSPPIPLENGGKIVWWANKIYMVEQGKGVHVINYTDPANPVKERFFSVPGCYEASVRNGYLIVNNGPDLVTLDISVPGNVTVLSRLPNVFSSISEAGSVPPAAVAGEYFECPDFSKGIVLRWERQTLTNPGCRVGN